MDNFTRLKRLDENALDAMKTLWAFDCEEFKAGAIDVFRKRLIAASIAHYPHSRLTKMQWLVFYCFWQIVLSANLLLRQSIALKDSVAH